MMGACGGKFGAQGGVCGGGGVGLSSPNLIMPQHRQVLLPRSLVNGVSEVIVYSSGVSYCIPTGQSLDY